MKCYPIKEYKKDYVFCEEIINIKGSRQKKFAKDTKGKFAFFKYEKYMCTEACSEKICYEIAKCLGYKCARIELAKDSNGILGVLNYIFIDVGNASHTDIADYLNINNENRRNLYTISNIKKGLDKIDSRLFFDFIKILVFDALVGEQDRHEENWGIIQINNKYEISPLYDNGCNLLRDFKNEEYAKSFMMVKRILKHILENVIVLFIKKIVKVNISILN